MGQVTITPSQYNAAFSMNNKLPFWNWSIQRTLTTLPDHLSQAQVKIFYILFVLNFAKIFFVFPEAIKSGSIALIVRYSYFILLTIFVLKILLSRPQLIKILTHILQSILGIDLWIKFCYHYKMPDILEVQTIFMNIMFSVFVLGRRWGAFYSVLSILAIMNSIIARNLNPNIHLSIKNSFGLSMVVLLNFMGIMIAVYHYYGAFQRTIDEKNNLNEQLITSLKTKSDFLSTMSHELRTPLNSVLGIADLLLEDKHNEEQKENLDVLKFSASNLLSLINNVLDFSKIEANKIQIESIAFDVSKLLREASAGFQKSALEKQLKFSLSIDPKLTKQWVIGDPTRLTQIIYNLVGNAIKFTHEGQVTMDVSIVEQHDNSITILFSIKDTGIGISTENQQIIFDPFNQSSSAITREFGGTGLGLSIVKHLLNLQSSDIYLESELYKGSHFYFNLQYQLTPEMRKSNSLRIHHQRKDLKKIKILLAEDNAANIYFMKKTLLSWNAEVTIAEDGVKVLDLLNRNAYDIILMDIHMPRMSGIQTAITLRQRHGHHIPIIALTASIDIDTISEIEASGMNDYLSKPFRNEILYDKLIYYSKH
ncbi:hypothetical protein GCM10027347_62180 [Larkinella harenae]